MIARALRVLAFAIALAGAIDPTITLTASSRPNVAIVAGASVADSALAQRVAGALSRKFNVLPGGFAQAAATVFVGDRLDLGGVQVHGPVFAVTPARGTPSVAINALHAPNGVPINGRVAITADVRVSGGRGGTLEVTLSADGIVVDRVAREITRDDALQRVALELTPTRKGVLPYAITASLGGGAEPALADGFVHVRDQRWSVFFYDPRPSWQSTFVRRALERDPRFVVTSRVVTSRALSRAAGQAPEDLHDPASLAPFDAIVIGAPDALSESAVTGLETLLRRHAGAVVLLFDRRSAAPVDRLVGTSWTGGTTRAPLVLQAGTPDSGALRATEVMWPARLPTAAITLARTPPARDSTTRAVVWSTVLGAGQLIVSGALNAWQFRAPEFDRFWQTLIGQVAGARQSAVDVRVAQPYLRPGEVTEVWVTLRDHALRPASAGATVEGEVEAELRSADSDVRVTMWPAAIGGFRGVLRAPARPGTYRLAVVSPEGSIETPVVVAPAIRRVAPDSKDELRALITSHGGRTLPESSLGDLSAAIERAVRPERRREARHPMRSFWWMFPFALALSAEWWVRRRSGLR